ncbi:MAG: ribonucleoside hydrolase RihC [Peptoniphilaceae bacterium]|nr:ribonucleoside hydrolase RihC [Peptoniphilaceae bacterium]MDY6018132.1 ribonucleoside hydrolase RihC [Anaerococcus sp.]
MKKHKIILDTDPGIDDAVAITAAINSDLIDTKLITSVSGNVDVDKTTNNVLKLLTFFDKNIEIAKGAEQPLIRHPVFASKVHGESGMDGYDFVNVNENLLSDHSAVHAMIHLLEKEDDLTIVCLGPLTNIASLLIAKPSIKEKIKNLVIMGGAIGRGNLGIYTEFNFGVDPEAARIIFESGLDISLFPIEVGVKARIFGTDIDKIKTYNQTGHMLYNLLSHYRSGSFDKGLNMYDLLTIAYLEDQKLFTMEEARVDIETQGEFTSGASLIDFTNNTPNAKIASDIDVERFTEWFKNAIKRCR